MNLNTLARKKIVYISDSPRSGTTRLDRTLGGSKGILGLGELVISKDYLGKPGAVFACGKHFSECDYWQKILNSPEIELFHD